VGTPPGSAGPAGTRFLDVRPGREPLPARQKGTLAASKSTPGGLAAPGLAGPFGMILSWRQGNGRFLTTRGDDSIGGRNV
jgi:hypothetical protein